MLSLSKGITIFALSCVVMGRMSFAQGQLSTIPTARMYPQGYMEFKLETLDPFSHMSLGTQLTDGLYAQLRQSAHISSLSDQAISLHHGLDFKLRLIKENATHPEITLGMNSAIGQNLLASEYFVMSKRYKSFDFSGGIAWGKLGSTAHIQNPLKSVFSHFGKERPINSNDESGPDHWFTGADVGFFGGVSYQTPWKPLQINADWGGDRYTIEENLVSHFNTPEPWAVGATVNVMKNMSFHGALIGGEKLMGRFIFSENLSENVTKKWKKSIPSKIRKGDKPDYSPQYMGLTSKRYIIPERQIYSSVSSPAELWHDLKIDEPEHEPYFKTNHFFKHKRTRLRLEEKFDVSDETNSLLFRNTAIIENIDETALGVLMGFGLRVNLNDNLYNIESVTTSVKENTTARSNEDLFTQKRVSVDRAYLAKNYSFGDVHTNVTAGYLEEMYAGVGGEILYRPYMRTYAFGIDGWHVYQRDPKSDFTLKLLSDSNLWTGHLKTYYEIPNTNTTVSAKAGRYLAQDWGGTVGISHLFPNGVDLSASITATNLDNVNTLGGTDNVFGELRIAVPLKIKRLPKPLGKVCCDVDVAIAPMARDSGQSLKSPFPLYKTSEPLSYRHLIQNWEEIRE